MPGPFALRHAAIAATTLAAAAIVASSSIARAQELLFELEGDNSTLQEFDDSFGVTCVGLPDVDRDGVADLLVGAHRYNTTKFRLEGAAFVFSGATHAQIRKHLGTSPNGQLGRSLDGGPDVDGDGIGDYVVGESYGDLSFLDSGTVHVYSGATGSELWTFVGERRTDYLGESVALIDDVDGDGKAEIVATAFLWDNVPLGFGQCGKAYCWSGATGNLIWSVEGVLSSQDLLYCARLGDVNGDGINDVGLGSIGTGTPGPGAGFVDIVDGTNGVVLRTIYGSASYDGFGNVRGTGDLDGDGVRDLLVGALNANNRRGRITAHSGATGLELFRHDGTQKNEMLNIGAVRGTFDWNRDGHDDYLFGSPHHALDDCSGGIAFLQSGKTGRRLFEFRSRDDLGVGPTLGISVSVVDDLTADSLPEILIGAHGAGSGQDGRVYVFAGDDLFLQADQSDFDNGDPIALELRGGTAGVLGLIAVTAIDGVPLFVPLVTAPLDANGELAFADVTDPAYLGHTVELRGWCQRAGGRGLVDSNLERFKF